MKLIHYFFSAILIINLLNSCKPIDKKSENQTSQLSEKLVTSSFSIEGMTCEIGCAKTIESKISKVDGVVVSKVNFDAKKGIFTYDSNKISEEKLIATINSLLDGKTYKASVGKIDCTNGVTKEIVACTEDCAEKCGHKKGESCEKCSAKEKACVDKKESKDCSIECAEKCGHKKGESCVKCEVPKNEDCNPDSKKTCCVSK